MSRYFVELKKTDRPKMQKGKRKIDHMHFMEKTPFTRCFDMPAGLSANSINILVIVPIYYCKLIIRIKLNYLRRNEKG